MMNKNYLKTRMYTAGLVSAFSLGAFLGYSSHPSMQPQDYIVRNSGINTYMEYHEDFLKRLPNYDSTRAGLYDHWYEGSYEDELIRELQEGYCPKENPNL